MEPLLKAVNLSHSVGALAVVRQVSLELYPGEVVGLAGQSGAGKSAVTMLLSGSLVPDGGDVFFAGQRLKWPFRARALGIEVVGQQAELAEKLDISRNVFLGREIGWPAWGRWLKMPNRRKMEEETQRILTLLGMSVASPRAPVTHLSGEQRQLIAIARAMIKPARLIILDDPGLLLSFDYQQKLLALIHEWRQQGAAVLFASDNVDRLMAVTDRIIVIRHGRCRGEYRTDETDREEILAAMVGTVDRQQLTPLIWALDSYYRAREQAEKLHQRQSLLNQDLGSREAVKRQLIDQMADEISTLDRANVALQDAQRRLLTELEQERKRLAREIHDQVIQDMLGVNFRLEEIEADERVTDALGDELQSIRGSVRDLVDDLRHICGTLRPPSIDSLGLGSALQSYAHEWGKRTGIAVSLDLDPNLGRLPEDAELSVFRIMQEALSNIRKHAGASAVEIRLAHTSPRGLMLSIADDGRGLPEDFNLAALSSAGHYGVLGIAERVALLGGRWRFQNQPSGGALVQVEIPHPRIESGGVIAG